MNEPEHVSFGVSWRECWKDPPQLGQFVEVSRDKKHTDAVYWQPGLGNWPIDGTYWREIQFRFTDPQQYHLTITGPLGDLVRISLVDGSMEFGPNYTPSAAAQTFWSGMIAEYREFLRWKQEHHGSLSSSSSPAPQ